MSITGYKELSDKLSNMGAAMGGQALRASAMSAMLPALEAARVAIPVADPPYHEGAGVKHTVGGGTTYGTGTVRTVDPYPRRTYRGRLVTPGFARRSLKRKALLSGDRTSVKVLLGVEQEAFYATTFVELGTRFMARRPWLEPAFRGAIGAVDAALQRELLQRIDAAAKNSFWGERAESLPDEFPA